MAWWRHVTASTASASGAPASARTPRAFLSALNVFDRRDPGYVTGGVGVALGLVLLGTAQGEVVALSAADGSESWRVDVGSEVLAAPAGGNGLVFVQTIDGRLLALERSSGQVRWSFDTQVPVLTLRGTGRSGAQRRRGVRRLRQRLGGRGTCRDR
jgi:outer membrane protein assembly factor BamB